jgi:DNA ligase (NAD+)
MNEAQAKKRTDKLRNDINYHNYRYYVLDNPIISDYE